MHRAARSLVGTHVAVHSLGGTHVAVRRPVYTQPRSYADLVVYFLSGARYPLRCAVSVFHWQSPLLHPSRAHRQPGMPSSTTVLCCPALHDASLSTLVHRIRSWIGPCQVWEHADLGSMEANAARLDAVVNSVGPVRWVGQGLGAALGYWLGCRREGSIQTGEFFAPFLGWNAPVFQSTRNKRAGIAEWALRLAHHEWAAVVGILMPSPATLAPRTSDLVPCGSWRELGGYTDSLDFVQMTMHYAKGSRLWLNRLDPDLQAERAAFQIRAMNPHVSVEIDRWEPGGFPDLLVETMGAKTWA